MKVVKFKVGAGWGGTEFKTEGGDLWKPSGNFFAKDVSTGGIVMFIGMEKDIRDHGASYKVVGYHIFDQDTLQKVESWEGGKHEYSEESKPKWFVVGIEDKE